MTATEHAINTSGDTVRGELEKLLDYFELTMYRNDAAASMEARKQILEHFDRAISSIDLKREMAQFFNRPVTGYQLTNGYRYKMPDAEIVAEKP